MHAVARTAQAKARKRSLSKPSRRNCVHRRSLGIAKYLMTSTRVPPLAKHTGYSDELTQSYTSNIRLSSIPKVVKRQDPTRRQLTGSLLDTILCPLNVLHVKNPDVEAGQSGVEAALSPSRCVDSRSTCLTWVLRDRPLMRSLSSG